MLGRPATTIRSDGCSPPVIRSRSINPVGVPVSPGSGLGPGVDLGEFLAQGRRVDPPQPLAARCGPDLEDRPFRLLQRRPNVVQGGHVGLFDPPPHVDQAPLHGQVQDDPRVMGDVGGGAHGIRQFGQIGRPADLGQHTPLVQGVDQGDQVHRLAGHRHVHHGGPDLPMPETVESLGMKAHFDSPVDALRLKQGRPQDGHFRFLAVRERGPAPDARPGFSVAAGHGHRGIRFRPILSNAPRGSPALSRSCSAICSASRMFWDLFKATRSA